MLVTLDLPDSLAEELLSTTSNLPRHILEGYALQAYRSGRLSADQLRALLNFRSDEEIDSFIKLAEKPEQDRASEDSATSQDRANRYPLQGTAYSYEDPFGPAAPFEDWEVFQ